MSTEYDIETTSGQAAEVAAAAVDTEESPRPKLPPNAIPWSPAVGERLASSTALAELRNHSNWVIWRWEPKSGGGWTKVLYDPKNPTQKAASNRPLTWGRFEEAVGAASMDDGAGGVVGGVGFVITNSPFCAFDLDKCRNPETGEIAPWARELIDACSVPQMVRNMWTGVESELSAGCYCEVTPSGTGLRILGTGSRESVGAKRIEMPDGGVLETFRGTPRYLTVTGEVFDGCDGPLKNLDPIIAGHDERYKAQAEPTKKSTSRATDTPWTPGEEEKLRSALAEIPSDDRDVWFRFGGAIYELGWGDVGKALWDEWSAKSAKFDREGNEETWEGFEQRLGVDGNTTVASIFYTAEHTYHWKHNPMFGVDLDDPDWSLESFEQDPTIETKQSGAEIMEHVAKGILLPGDRLVFTDPTEEVDVIVVIRNPANFDRRGCRSPASGRPAMFFAADLELRPLAPGDVVLHLRADAVMVRELIETGDPENAADRLIGAWPFAELSEAEKRELIGLASKLSGVQVSEIESGVLKGLAGSPSNFGTRMMYCGCPKRLVTLQDLNSRYAIYSERGTLVYVTRENSWIIPKATLMESLEDKIVLAYVSEEKPVYKPAGKMFTGNCDKTVYDKMVFSGDNKDASALNLFHGFGVRPREGDCSLILNHILDVVCSGDREAYERLLDLNAWQIQNIGEPSRIIVVLVTANQQAGKGAYLDLLCDIYGPSGTMITDKRHVLDKFNSHIQGKAFVWFDESIFGGSVQDANRLRTLSTAKTTTVEGKGLPVIESPIAVNFYMASNSERAAYVEEGDARYWVLKCSEHRIGDDTYFDALHRQIKEGGREAFAKFLLTRDVSNFLPQRDCPRENAEKKAMQSACWNPGDFRNFLQDCCVSGSIRHARGAGNSELSDVDWVEGDSIYLFEIVNAYNDWQKNIHSAQRIETTCARMRGIYAKAAGLVRARGTTGSRKEYYILPSRNECLRNLNIPEVVDDAIIKDPPSANPDLSNIFQLVPSHLKGTESLTRS